MLRKKVLEAERRLEAEDHRIRRAPGTPGIRYSELDWWAESHISLSVVGSGKEVGIRGRHLPILLVESKKFVLSVIRYTLPVTFKKPRVERSMFLMVLLCSDK